MGLKRFKSMLAEDPTGAFRSAGGGTTISKGASISAAADSDAQRIHTNPSPLKLHKMATSARKDPYLGDDAELRYVMKDKNSDVHVGQSIHHTHDALAKAKGLGKEHSGGYISRDHVDEIKNHEGGIKGWAWANRDW